MVPYLSILQTILLLSGPSRSCHFHGSSYPSFDVPLISRENIRSRTIRTTTTLPSQKIAIDNVRVFDGHKLLKPATVIIDGSAIVTNATGATHLDGKGGVLLPGLIDSHCHPSNVTHLEDLTRFGVTTGMVLACYSHEMCASLQNHRGLVDLRRSSAPAAAPGSAHGNVTAMVDQTGISLVNNTEQAKEWIERQVSTGAEYIKLVAEVPGLDQATLNALTRESHSREKMVLCHASSYAAFRQAMVAQVDQIHHTPLDRPVDAMTATQIYLQKQVSVPTLTMMQAVAKNIPMANFSAANASVTILHKVGITILTGTDANLQPGVPAGVPFGSSIHLEMELLVAAGISTVETLQAATSLPAKMFGMLDRGVIKPGMRADLLLINGDPIADIRATRDIKGVWVAGMEYTGALGFS